MSADFERRIHILVVARYVLPWPYDRHELDFTMFMKWCQFANVSLIVQAKDGKARTWQKGPLTVHYLEGTRRPLLRVLEFVAKAIRKAAEIHREAPVDILSASDLSGGMVGIFVKARLKIKVLQQVQGAFLEGPGPGPKWAGWTTRPAIRALVIYLCRQADMVRCLYSASAKRVLAAGVPRHRIAIVPSRCDMDLFRRTGENEIRSPSEPAVLFAGNLTRAKGLRTLMAAVHQLLNRGVLFKLWIVGDGPDRKYLESQARGLGLDQHVKFWGRVSHTKLPAIMQQSYLLTLPSQSEATPRVIMEAMAMELPVVATDVGGIPELVRDGETGILVKPDNVAELGSAIATLLNDPVTARAMGLRGKEHACERYDLDQYVRRMIALHQQTLSV